MRTLLSLAACCIAGIAVTYAAEPQGNTVQLVLVDLQGQKTVLGNLPDSVVAPRVSPDGKQVTFELTDPPAPKTAPSVKVYVADLNKLDQRGRCRRPLSNRSTSRRSGRPTRYGSCSRVPAMVLMICSERASLPISPNSRSTSGWALAGERRQQRPGHLSHAQGRQGLRNRAAGSGTRAVTRLVDQAGSAQYSGAISRIADGSRTRPMKRPAGSVAGAIAKHRQAGAAHEERWQPSAVVA